MNITQKHPVRLTVANLSTGNRPNQYYDEISHWWDAVVKVLEDAGIPPIPADCPAIYNDEGRWNVPLENTNSTLVFTWYRMPSFRWEIICYLT